MPEARWQFYQKTNKGSNQKNKYQQYFSPFTHVAIDLFLPSFSRGKIRNALHKAHKTVLGYESSVIQNPEILNNTMILIVIRSAGLQLHKLTQQTFLFFSKKNCNILANPVSKRQTTKK
jgi:hypothetical protein